MWEERPPEALRMDHNRALPSRNHLVSTVELQSQTIRLLRMLVHWALWHCGIGAETTPLPTGRGSRPVAFV
jgi:hypothetical protein